jgi:hypothetical protein
VRRHRGRALRRRYGHGRKSSKGLVRFEAEVERLLVHHGVSPGQVSVWMTNHGALIRESFASGSTPGAVAERIVQFESEESAIPWKPRGGGR